MAYDVKLADDVREYLVNFPEMKVEEKKMFGGLSFLINEKMCVGVSGDRLMCRFNPVLQDQLSEKNGYQPMIMKGREYPGFCYVDPCGYRTKKELERWIDLCLDYNDTAKSSKKKNKSVILTTIYQLFRI